MSPNQLQAILDVMPRLDPIAVAVDESADVDAYVRSNPAAQEAAQEAAELCEWNPVWNLL